MIELENQSTRVASRRARCLTALDPRPRVLEFIVLEGLTSPLMLTTTLLGPSSIGIQSYVCTLRPVEGKGGSERAEKYLPKYPRRSRWRRWRFFFFFFFLGGLGCSPGPFLPLPSEPPEHRRNEFSLLLYPVSAARAPSLLSPLCRYTVITVSRRRDLPPSCHARIKARITIHDGRECVFLTILRTILRNTVKNRTKNTRRSRSLTDVHRCFQDQEEERRNTRKKKKKNIYVYIRIRKEEREGSITGITSSFISFQTCTYPRNGFIQRHDVCCVQCTLQW